MIAVYEADSMDSDGTAPFKIFDDVIPNWKTKMIDNLEVSIGEGEFKGVNIVVIEENIMDVISVCIDFSEHQRKENQPKNDRETYLSVLDFVL